MPVTERVPEQELAEQKLLRDKFAALGQGWQGLIVAMQSQRCYQMTWLLIYIPPLLPLFMPPNSMQKWASNSNCNASSLMLCAAATIFTHGKALA